MNISGSTLRSLASPYFDGGRVTGDDFKDLGM